MSQTVNVSEFALNRHMYVDRFEVSAELEEFGTGGSGRRGVPRGGVPRGVLLLTWALWLLQGWF